MREKHIREAQELPSNQQTRNNDLPWGQGLEWETLPLENNTALKYPRQLNPGQSIPTCVTGTKGGMKIKEGFFVHKISAVSKHRLCCSCDVCPSQGTTAAMEKKNHK